MIKSNFRHLKMTHVRIIVDKFKNRKRLLPNLIQCIKTFIFIFLFPAIIVRGKLRHFLNAKAVYKFQKTS